MQSTQISSEATVAVPPATVFVVDDDPDVRQLVSLLARSVGLAEDAYPSAQEFLDHYDPQKPGCLVLDIRMPGMSGLELQKSLNATALIPPIIFISAYGEIPLAIQAIRGGAVDFLQKPFSPQGLLERILQAIELDRENRLIRRQTDEIQGRMTQLTERESQIMRLLARGQSTKQIAHLLSISPKTVDNHRGKILEKMQVDNPTQLAHLAAQLDDRSAVGMMSRLQ